MFTVNDLLALPAFVIFLFYVMNIFYKFMDEVLSVYSWFYAWLHDLYVHSELEINQI